MVKRSRRLLLVIPAAVLASLGGFAVTAQSAGLSFSTPVQLPGSSGLGEPSLAIDHLGNLFVTAPQALGNVTGGGSPVWTSTAAQGGTSWGNPVSPAGDPVSGGDTDLAIDAANDVYQTDLWLGNSAMAVSTDHGQSFVANEWGHTQPVDDRPWLAYDGSSNTLYLAWDGADAIHVGRTLPLSDPHEGLLFAQDVPAVPECVLGGSNPCSTPPIRQCVCPPGGIAVDQKSGQVYVSYSRQNGGSLGGGVGVARSDNGGLDWSYFSVPGTGSTGAAFDTEWNFSPVAVDSAGGVYVSWGEGLGPVTTDANGNNVYNGGVAIRYSYSGDHGQTWTKPVTVSVTPTAVFPTLDVVSPGVIDVAYYGNSAKADPNFAKGAWNLYVTQVTGANTAAPKQTSAEAVSSIHSGCIQAGGGSQCSDRSLLDFFQLRVDASGLANVVFTEGDSTHGTNLFFVKQVGGRTHVSPSPAPSPAGRGHHGSRPRSGWPRPT